MNGRVVWFTAGVGVGIAASRRVARAHGATTAASLATGLMTRAWRIVDGVITDAISDGRAEMHHREARLREVLAAPGGGRPGIAGGRR